MKKKKLSLRRRFPRLLKFGLIIAALAVGIALYRYYFVPQPATIALLVEEGGNNGVTLVQTQAEEKRDTGTIVNKETGKRVRVKKISDTTELNAAIAEAKKTTATGAGTGITAPATTQDPTTIRYGNKEGCESLCKSVVGAKCTEVTSTGSSQGWYCIKDNSLPATNTSINDADMCTVGNTRAAKGSWVATGYGLNENNNHCAGTAPSCPYRECVKVEDDCTTNSKTATKCGDKFAEDPTKVISSSAMGCEYYATAGNTCPTDRPLATCYTSSGAYPSGSKRSDGKICNDGKWVDVPDQKLCDSLYGQGKSIPDSKTNGCKLVVAKATDPCDSLRAQCSNAGKICKVNPTNNVAYCETDPSKLKSAGTVVSSASECASGKATPNAAPLIQGNTGVNGWICTGGKENDIVGTASQCESNFATPTGTPGKVKCQTCKEGINVQDASGRSYYTCEGSKAVYHVCPPGQIRKDYRMAPSECIPDPKLATPAQPEEEKPVSIDPKTLDHLGEECDGTYANKDASGKYTSVPACAQLCDKGVDGKIASKPSNGKIVCDTPKLVADTPAKPEEENKDEELADGAQCGSLGYPSCSKCPMGISTEYKEQGATGTFSKCGRQSEVEKILAEDRVPDSQQTIIGTNNANDGEKSDSETVTDTVGGAATGALILGGVGCVAAIAGGFFTGGLAWALAPAACISFGAAGALAGGTIGGILGFLK